MSIGKVRLELEEGEYFCNLTDFYIHFEDLKVVLKMLRYADSQHVLLKC